MSGTACSVACSNVFTYDTYVFLCSCGDLLLGVAILTITESSCSTGSAKVGTTIIIHYLHLLLAIKDIYPRFTSVLKLGGASFLVVSKLWYLSLVINYVDESSVLFLNNHSLQMDESRSPSGVVPRRPLDDDVLKTGSFDYSVQIKIDQLHCMYITLRRAPPLVRRIW